MTEAGLEALSKANLIFDTGPDVDSRLSYVEIHTEEFGKNFKLTSLQVGDESPTNLRFQAAYGGIDIDVGVLEVSPGSTIHLNGTQLIYDELILGEGAQILDADCSGDRWVNGNDLRCVNVDTIDYIMDRLDVLVGDFNTDGEVSFADFTVLSANYGDQADNYTQGDANVDGVVGFEDFLILADVYGDRSGSDWAWSLNQVPEPNTSVLGLFAALCMAVCYRRRRRIVSLEITVAIGTNDLPSPSP